LVFDRYLPATGRTAARWGVLTIDADGGEPTLVVEVFPDDQEDVLDQPPTPGFSPSGERIIYTTEHSIHTIRSDGTDPRRVLSGGFFNEAQYSPNGRRILFSGQPRRKGGRFGMWIMRRNGSRLRRLPAGGLGDYSPDGRHIVFLGEAGISVMRADGSHERVIADVPFAGDPLAYAPAGDRIAFPVHDGAPHLFERCVDLYTISSTGSDLQNVTNGCPSDATVGLPAVGFPSWQPDPPGFSFAGVKRNERRGTAKLRVVVPISGALALAETAEVEGAEERAEAAGEEVLPVRPTGRATKRLDENGQARVQVEVIYIPDGGEPNTRSKRIKLVKR
jgi:Tol biopolymer transport system component